MPDESEHIIRQQHFVAGVETGIDSERERIITLLGDDADIWHSENFQRDLIALIKGDVAERRQTRMPEYGDKGENK